MATDPWTKEPPTIAERYEGAANTSNLTVFGGMIPDGSSAGTAEIVLAAGLAQRGQYGTVRLGMALLRLHSEWSASAKPNKASPKALQKMVEAIKEQDSRDKETASRQNKSYAAPGSPTTRAYATAQAWYTNELRLLANRLKSKGAVVRELTEWAVLKGIPPDTVAEAVLYWLDSTCPNCHGHGLRYAEHQAVRQCFECDGTGNTRRTQEVGRVLNHIGYALGIARGRTAKTLRELRK